MSRLTVARIVLVMIVGGWVGSIIATPHSGDTHPSVLGFTLGVLVGLVVAVAAMAVRRVRL